MEDFVNFNNVEDKLGRLSLSRVVQYSKWGFERPRVVQYSK
jgi:hypothetical protein